MTIEKALMVMAGIMVLASAILTHYHNPLWVLLTGFVGFNLIQSQFTGFCPPAMIMKKMGMKSEAEKAQENT